MIVTCWILSLFTAFIGMIALDKGIHLISMVFLAVSGIFFAIPIIKDMNDRNEV